MSCFKITEIIIPFAVQCDISAAAIYSISRNSSCGKVMFSQAYVIPSVHGGGACVATGGASMQERRPLKRAVRILLECILV